MFKKWTTLMAALSGLLTLQLLLAVPSRPAETALRLKIAPPPPTPARLSLSVSFKDPSGNAVLDAGETGHFLVTVTNHGPGTAHGVHCDSGCLKAAKGLPSPSPSGWVTSRQGRRPNTNWPFQPTAMFIQAGCGSRWKGWRPTALMRTRLLYNSTRAFEPPALAVVDMGINDTSQNGQVEPMEVVEVTARVKNTGRGTAGSVEARVILGENVFKGPESGERFDLGDLAPGEHRDVIFSFLTNKRIAAGERIPVSLSLREKRAGVKVEAPLDLVMNRPQRRSGDIVIASRDDRKPETPQEPASSLSIDVDQNIPVGQPAGPFDVAVILGNSRYQRQGVPEVKYAYRDAGVMREYLVRTLGFRPENILFEQDGTKGTFETLFGSRFNPKGKLYRWVKPGQSRVFIYYVGHGAPSTDTGEAFFVPVDADPDYIATSGYPLSVFYANLKGLPAREVIVVMDACFSGRSPSGLLLKNVSPALLRVKETAAGLREGVVLSSAREDQVSTWYEDKRQSLFTYYFLKGLRGEADQDRNKAITVGEMETYLLENVPYMAGRLSFPPAAMGDKMRLELYPLKPGEPCKEAFKIIASKDGLDFSFLPVPENRIYSGAHAGEIQRVSKVLEKADGWSDVVLGYWVSEECR